MAGLIGLAAVTVPVQAHHSFAAYDMTRTLTQACTVKEFDWFNPHTFIVAGASDAQGKVREFRFEGAPPAVLLGNGWTKDALHYHDAISVEYHPLRNGLPGGTYVAVILPSGKRLDAHGAFFFGANSPEKSSRQTAPPAVTPEASPPASSSQPP